MLEQAELYALIISVLAGLSTLLGAFIVFFTKGNSKKLLAVALGFSAGVILSVTLLDLFPGARAMFSEVTSDRISLILSIISLAAGVIIARVIDFFVPHQEFDKSTGETPHKNLFRIGVISMVAIGLHNLPEGIAIFMAGYSDTVLGIVVAIAIALHNIPEGISVALPVYYATKSKRKALRFAFLSGIAEPIGAFLTFLILRPFINAWIMGIVFAFICGIMLYVALEELIPSSRQYGYDKEALIATFVGIIVMPLTHLI